MSLSSATILLATVDGDAAQSLSEVLRVDGHEPIVRNTCDAAIASLAADRPELAVVWLELPDALGGFKLIRTIRGASPLHDAIDPLTALIAIDPGASEFSCLRAFEQGCDDYLATAHSVLEFRARIAALLRRTCRHVERSRITLGALEIDCLAHEARVDGRRVELAPKEFALLSQLASQPNRVFTKAELLRSIWGYRSLGCTRTLDTHASRLRRKLAAVGATTNVRTVWGVGYRLTDEPAPIAA